MSISADRINKIAQLNGAYRYLEIGLDRGATFGRVKARYKIGVEPHF